MKKLLAILFAALLIVGVAACGSKDNAADNANDNVDVVEDEGNDAEPEENNDVVDANATGVITYDDLDGYEKVEAMGATTFMAQDDDTSFRMITFLPVDDETAAGEMREALDSQDFSELEEAYAAAMENVEISSSTVGQTDVIFLSGVASAQGVEGQSVTALTIIGQQVAMVQGVSDVDNADQLKADMDTFIGSFKLAAGDSADADADADATDADADEDAIAEDEAPVDADAEDEAAA